MKNSTMLTGLFHERDSAERAYQTMYNRGYDKGDVSLVMSDDTRKRCFSGNAEKDTKLSDKAADSSSVFSGNMSKTEGAGIGGAIGGTLGAIAGAVAAIGTTLILPGLGLVIAGPIAAAVAGLGAGGVAGGLIGALTNSGIPEDRVKHYENGIKNGGILLGVTPRNEQDAEYFEQQWALCGGVHVHRESLAEV